MVKRASDNSNKSFSPKGSIKPSQPGALTDALAEIDQVISSAEETTDRLMQRYGLIH